MPTYFARVISYLDDSMQRSLSNAAHQLVAVGAIAFFGFIIFYWVWTVWFPQPYETFALRLFGSLLGLGLMLTPLWPDKVKAYLPWYWFVTILYTLSFFFAFSFLMNQASVISSMSLICSVFLLVLLVDLLSFSIVLLLGWSLAMLVYWHFAPTMYFGQAHLEVVMVLIFVIIAGSTVNYKTAMQQQQRLDGMAAAAGMIAHELRTPLLGIKSGAQAMSLYAPKLLQGYLLAKEHGLISEPIRDLRLRQLEGVSERIISEIDYANTIIDMLLVKAGRENSLAHCILEPCSMADCLEEAMNRYPFKSTRERSLVQYRGDFQFRGSKLLMQHVLFNLLKNALYAIAHAQKGEIEIWAESGLRHNHLYFKDTAKGLSRQELGKLFNHFYSTSLMGTGVGLSFCKLVMRRFGGDISCEAIEGHYALFSLSFPRLGMEKR
jgi:signal transduction histidine kinase